MNFPHRHIGPDDSGQQQMLAALGHAVRARSDARVVAITGSVGKTSTKDILAALLRTRVRTYFTASETRSRMGEMVGIATTVDGIVCATPLEAAVRELRLIAERFPKADIHAVLDAIGSDSRIGKKYLRAGLSFGGPCLPRDNRLLAYAAREKVLAAPLAEATDRVNRSANEALLEKVRGLVEPNDVIAVLGLAYKPDTYITEEAAGLFLAQQLKRHGYRVVKTLRAENERRPKFRHS